MATTLPTGLSRKTMPKHVAIIMDGNGRWAKERGFRRIRGHEEGVHSVRAIAEEGARLGLEQVTLYTFSSQNWGRPPTEVSALMRLLRQYLVGERDTLMENDIRLVAIGRRGKLSKAVLRDLEDTERLTADNQGMILCLALSYGSREEIVDAVRAIAKEAVSGELKPAKINEKTISRHLYTVGMRDPDLLVRTAGEMRVSNFLLWQISYAELYVTDVCWPDFREEQFHDALRAYATRCRTYGLVKP